MATKYSKQLEPVRPPTDLEFMWVVGFLEGEGSFSAMSGTDRRARICAGQNSPEVLQKLLEWFGGKIYPRGEGKHHQWMLRGPKARLLLEQLLPYMSTRRQGQIKAALASSFSLEHGSEERKLQRSRLRAEAHSKNLIQEMVG